MAFRQIHESDSPENGFLNSRYKAVELVFGIGNVKLNPDYQSADVLIPLPGRRLTTFREYMLQIFMQDYSWRIATPFDYLSQQVERREGLARFNKIDGYPFGNFPVVPTPSLAEDTNFTLGMLSLIANNSGLSRPYKSENFGIVISNLSVGKGLVFKVIKDRNSQRVQGNIAPFTPLQSMRPAA